MQGGWYVNVTVPDAARSYDLSITTATIMGTREYPLASGYFDTYITAPPGGGGLAIEALELRDVTDMANPVVVERIVNVGTWPPAGTATINSFGAPAVSAEAGPNELGISFQQPEKQLLDNGTEIDTEFPPQLYQMGVQLAQGLGDNPIIRGTITVDDASRDLLYDATVDPEIGSIVGDVQADPQGAALNRITLRSNDGGMILEDTGPPNLAAILLGKNLYVTNARNPAELVEYSTRTGGADSVTFTRAAEQGTIYVGLFAQAGAISLRRFNPSGLSNDFGTAHTSTADGVSDIRALFQYDERLWGVAASGDNLQFYRTGQGRAWPVYGVRGFGWHRVDFAAGPVRSGKWRDGDRHGANRLHRVRRAVHHRDERRHVPPSAHAQRSGGHESNRVSLRRVLHAPEWELVAPRPERREYGYHRQRQKTELRSRPRWY